MLKKNFFISCLILGFVVIIGTAGASDCEAIIFGQIIKQSAFGLFLMVVGVRGLIFKN